MPNIRFSFLYRDAANYKTFFDLVFANPDEIPLDTVRAIVRSGCNVDLCFDPVKQFKVQSLKFKENAGLEDQKKAMLMNSLPV